MRVHEGKVDFCNRILMFSDHQTVGIFPQHKYFIINIFNNKFFGSDIKKWIVGVFMDTDHGFSDTNQRRWSAKIMKFYRRARNFKLFLPPQI